MGNDPAIALGGNWLVRITLLVLLTRTQNQYWVLAVLKVLVLHEGKECQYFYCECKNKNQDLMKDRKLSEVLTAVFCERNLNCSLSCMPGLFSDVFFKRVWEVMNKTLKPGMEMLNLQALKVCCYPMWNCSRKLFIMQETFRSNLANAFVKAFEGNALAKVFNSCQNAADSVLGLQSAGSSVLPRWLFPAPQGSRSIHGTSASLSHSWRCLALQGMSCRLGAGSRAVFWE